MEELPVEDLHMATAERQLHDWERFIMGKKLTDDMSNNEVWPRFPIAHASPTAQGYQGAGD